MSNVQHSNTEKNDPVLSMNYSQQVVNPFFSPYFMNPSTNPMMIGQFMQPTQSMPQPQQSVHQVSVSIKFPIKSLKFKFQVEANNKNDSSVKKVAKKRGRAVKDAHEAADEMETVTWPKKRGRPAKILSETVEPAKRARRALALKNM